MKTCSFIILLNLLALGSTFRQSHSPSNGVQVNTNNGMTVIKPAPNSCIYMSGKVYDNGNERRATPQEIAMIAQHEKDWERWAQEFNVGMQEHMAQSFPPGFPFNQPKAKAPQFSPPKPPVLPCFCVDCNSAQVNFNAN